MGSVRRVGGVDIRLVNEDLMLREISRLVGELGIEVQVPWHCEGRVRTLVELIVRRFDKADLVDCAVCGGDGPFEALHCSFCGAGDPELETTEAKKMQQKEGKLVRLDRNRATARDLDMNVEEITRAKTKAAICYWELGQLIKENYEKGLWRLRLSKDGKSPKYSNFSQFCRKELGFSHAHAFQMMDVAKAFDRETVKKFGSTKLGLVLQVPQEQRAKMVDSLKEGASKRELREMARGKSSDKGRKTIQNRPAGQPTRKGKITVASLLGETVLPLKVEGDDGKLEGATVDDLTREDFKGSFCVEQMLGGVTSRYEIQVGQDGELSLKITRERED